MEDIRGTLSKLASSITKTSTDVIKTTKLNVSLVSEEDKLKSLYMEIGKKVHEIYAYGGSLGKFFDEKYAEILKQESVIDEIKSQINIVKGSRTCPGCGKTVDKNAGFCPKCGYKLSDETETEKQTEISKVSVEINEKSDIINCEKVRICSICSAENNPDSKFCLSCGRLLQ